MIYNTILDAMGHTPIIRLNRMNKPGNAQVLVKFEGLNVGGSIKSRTAYNMILAAEEKGLIHEDKASLTWAISRIRFSFCFSCLRRGAAAWLKSLIAAFKSSTVFSEWAFR